jgi:flagellar biogenesis protein FliO
VWKNVVLTATMIGTLAVPALSAESQQSAPSHHTIATVSPSQTGLAEKPSSATSSQITLQPSPAKDGTQQHATPYREGTETSRTSIRFQPDRKESDADSSSASSIQLAGGRDSGVSTSGSDSGRLRNLASSFGPKAPPPRTSQASSSASLSPVGPTSHEATPAGSDQPRASEGVVQPLYSRENQFEGSLRDRENPESLPTHPTAPENVAFPEHQAQSPAPPTPGFSDMSVQESTSSNSAPPSELPSSTSSGATPAPLEESQRETGERLAARDSRNRPPPTASGSSPRTNSSGENENPEGRAAEGELPPLNFSDKEPKKESNFEHPMTGMGAMIPVIGSLVVVLGVFFALAVIMRRAHPKGMAQLPKEVFETLGRAPLTSRLQLQLLRLGDRLILVAVSPDGVETICEVSHPDEVVHLLGLCRRHEENSSTSAFRQVLNQFAQEPVEGGYFGTDSESLSSESIPPMTSSANYHRSEGSA